MTEKTLYPNPVEEEISLPFKMEDEIDVDDDELDMLIVEEEPSELSGKRVLVTGGTGFLGKHVIEELERIGAKAIGSNSKEYDLTSYEQTRGLFNTYRPDYVIHCAGHNGGIEFNRLYPAEILDINTRMALNVHKVSRELGVRKVLSIITSCAYPDGNDVLEEDKFFDGLPNGTVRGHGMAKRMLQTCAEEYNKQFGLNAVCCAVTNLYGPHDTFNLTRTKVVGAVIRKVVEAYQNDDREVEFWGTGSSKRQFMFVKDAAQVIVEALEKYEDHTKPLNIGTPYEVTIKKLVNTVVKVVDYDGNIYWNKDKGDGQMRKMMDITTMEELLDIEWKMTELEDGITETVNWYIENKKLADEKK